MSAEREVAKLRARLAHAMAANKRLAVENRRLQRSLFLVAGALAKGMNETKQEKALGVTAKRLGFEADRMERTP